MAEDDIIQYWKDFHRKISDALNCKYLETGVTLEAVKNMVEQNEFLVRNSQVVRTGVATVVTRQKNNIWEVLLGKRCGTFRPGVFALPGGKPDFGESPEDTAKRETFEECGLELGALTQVGWINNYFPNDNQHWCTICYLCKYFTGKPSVKELDKFKNWDWYSFNDLPSPLWKGLDVILKRSHNILKP